MLDDTNLQTPQDGTQDAGDDITPVTPGSDNSGDGGAAGTDPAALAEENKRLKDKLSNSAREAQVLLGKNRELEEKLRGSSLTDEEVRQAYPEWEHMTQNEQRLARENLTIKKDLANVSTTLNGISAEKRINDVIQSNTALKGREKEFRDFLNKPSHRGVSIEVLTNAFLYESDQDDPPQRAPKKEVKGLDTSSGLPGQGQKTEKKKYTNEQIQQIYNTDKRRYMQLVQNGDI